MSLLIRNLIFNQPLLRRLLIRADQKHFLHRPCAGVLAFQACVRRILNLKTGRRMASPGFDSAWDDARHMRTGLDDMIEQVIEPRYPPMLPFNASKLHCASTREYEAREVASERPSDLREIAGRIPFSAVVLRRPDRPR